MSEMYKKLSEGNGDELVYIMKGKIQLLPFLLEVLTPRSRNSIKSILKRGQVKVDDYIVTQFNYQLKQGQRVEILTNRAAIRDSKLIGLTIVYEDKDLIVIEKDAGLLSIASEREKEFTAHHQLMNYVRAENPANRIFVVHRLDKDTSGLMIFAKNERTKNILQKSWRDMVKKRSYVALVTGHVKKKKDTIKSWLKESKTKLVYSSYKKGDGLTAVTHYRVIQSNNDYSLLDVELETGRKNQIRVHMKDIGHPVVGDKKYGDPANVIGRLGLHARELIFTHPTTKKTMHFEAKVPKSFIKKSK